MIYMFVHSLLFMPFQVMPSIVLGSLAKMAASRNVSVCEVDDLLLQIVVLVHIVLGSFLSE